MYSRRGVDYCKSTIHIFLRFLLKAMMQFGKIVLRSLGYSDRETVVMGIPCDGIQLLIIVLAGIISQVIPNTRWMMMILANIIVLIGSVLIESKFYPTT